MKGIFFTNFLVIFLFGFAFALDRPKAPDFALPSVVDSAETLRLSDLEGKVVIIDFWATWCKPCRMEIPGFIDLYKNYKDSGFVMVGIALDRLEKVRKFQRDQKMNYPLVMGNNKVTRDYGGIRGIPTTFVLDRKGRIYKKYVGYRPKTIFENDVKTLLKESYGGEEKGNEVAPETSG